MLLSRWKDTEAPSFLEGHPQERGHLISLFQLKLKVYHTVHFQTKLVLKIKVKQSPKIVSKTENNVNSV